MSYEVEAHGYLCQLSKELTKACGKVLRRQNSDFGIKQYYDKDIDPQNPAVLSVTSTCIISNTKYPQSSMVTGGVDHKNSRFWAECRRKKTTYEHSTKLIPRAYPEDLLGECFSLILAKTE